MVGKPIKEMRELLGSEVDSTNFNHFRRDHAVLPTGNTIIEDGDEVFVLAADEHIRRVMTGVRRMMTPVRRVIIAGGGNIGLRVAKRLEGRCIR